MIGEDENKEGMKEGVYLKMNRRNIRYKQGELRWEAVGIGPILDFICMSGLGWYGPINT